MTGMGLEVHALTRASSRMTYEERIDGLASLRDGNPGHFWRISQEVTRLAGIRGRAKNARKGEPWRSPDRKTLNALRDGEFKVMAYDAKGKRLYRHSVDECYDWYAECCTVNVWNKRGELEMSAIRGADYLWRIRYSDTRMLEGNHCASGRFTTPMQAFASITGKKISFA